MNKKLQEVEKELTEERNEKCTCSNGLIINEKGDPDTCPECGGAGGGKSFLTIPNLWGKKKKK